MKQYLVLGFDRFAFWLVSIALFILPILAVPVYGLAFDVGKKFLLVGLVLLAILSWLVGRLQENRFTIPKNWILAAAGLIGLSFLVSALLSGSVWSSLIGLGYEQLTFFSIFVYLLLLFLVSILFQTKGRIVNFFIGLTVSFGLVFIFQGFRLLWGGFIDAPFPLTAFANSAVNLIGKWNDLGLFFGLIAVMAVALRELLPFSSSRVLKTSLTMVLGAAIVGLVVVNFYSAWVLVAAASLMVFIYGVSFHDRLHVKREGGRLEIRMLRPAFIVFLIALVFVVLARSDSWLSNTINNFNQKLEISSLEVRPSWRGTNQILSQTLKQDPIFGVGPNKFVDQWLKYKPAGVNDTLFWNIDFDSGISFMPTIVVMTGAFGGLAILLLLGAILFYAGRALFSNEIDQVSRGLLAVNFICLVYLIVATFIYTSDTVMLAITFALIGLFVAGLKESGATGELNLSLLRDPKTSFVSIFSFVAVLLVAVVGGYFVAQKFWSVIYFQRALATFNQSGNIEEAYASVERTIKLSREDLYYRSLSELNILQMGVLVNKPGQEREALSAALKLLVDSAIANSEQAIDLNKNGYMNWVSKARVYETLVPLSIDGAYEMAVKHYQEAFRLNPNNPAILLSLAQLEVSQGKTEEAKAYLNQAIGLKRNYTNALFALIQLEIGSGNIGQVMKKVEDAVILSPNDVGLLFQLGFLYYQQENYQGAAQALNQAVSISPNYSNARYFLGLALDKLGAPDEALKQFIAIEKLNPDNAEVKMIINNLRSGYNALYQAPQPEPEDRKEPPIKETN